MRTTISILLCKLITVICKVLGPIFHKEGSVLPGRCIAKIQKNVLDRLKYPLYVVAVTGSSGKGSTVSMVAHILEGNGKKVVWNKNGSNVRSAIITLLLNNTRAFSHKVSADVVLLEMDERFITGTFRPGIITHMAITNITRDQPSRNIHPDIIFSKIFESIDDSMHLILNVDDPLLAKGKFVHSGSITTYGIDETSSASKKILDYPVDAAYCPSCHTKLVYDFYHYGHLGKFSCPRCSFGRGKLDFEAKNVDFEKGTFELDDRTLKLNKSVYFAVYYTLLAYTICDLINIDEDGIVREINENEMDSKRGKKYFVDERKVEMLESKNENALSYLQSIDYIKMQPGKKVVIMGFENVSRRYKYNDLSWLWDVPFEGLADEHIEKIFCIGRFRYDVAARLRYAGIDEETIFLVNDLDNLISDVQSMSSGDVYTMVCFDMTAIIKKQIEGVTK